MTTAANYTQLSFRGRNDDGSEAAATWQAAENVNWGQIVGVKFRVRFEIQENNSVGTANTFILQHAINGAAFVTTTTSTTGVQLVASGTVADAAATTNQNTTSAKTFLAGIFDSNGTVASLTLNNTHTEMEYCLQLVSANLFNGDQIQFRVTKAAGAALDVYSQTPTIAATGGAEININSAQGWA